MSRKQDKKLRKLYRKDLGKQAEQHATEVQRRIDEYTKQLDDLLKPAPWFVPDFIWVSLQKVFLNV